MTKETLRKHYKTLRASLGTKAVADQSLAIANRVLQLPIWEYTNYHVFLPIENKIEVDTSYLLSVLQGKDKSVILSKSNFDIEKLQNEFPIKIFNSFTEFFNKSASSIDKLYHELLYGINEWRRFQDEDNEFEGRIIGTNGLGNLSVENKKGTVKHYPLKSIRFIF